MTTAPAATPLPPPGGAVASVLADLLRSIGRTETSGALASEVCEVLVRGLALDGALLRMRDGDGLRALGGMGVDVATDTVPPAAADLHPWPAVPGPF
ncbi:MAG TPA: hypothetical protein VGG91_21250, partial [Myxococcaceae bacterium]